MAFNTFTTTDSTYYVHHTTTTKPCYDLNNYSGSDGANASSYQEVAISSPSRSPQYLMMPIDQKRAFGC